MNKKNNYKIIKKRRLLIAFFFFLSNYANDELDNDEGLKLVVRNTPRQINQNQKINQIENKQPVKQFVAYPEQKITSEAKDSCSGCKLCCVLGLLAVGQCGPCIVCILG